MSTRPISDTWYLARTKTKDPNTGRNYYGAYPAGFLERARLVLGVKKTDTVWHICGGHAREYNGIKGGIHLTGFGLNDLTFDLDHLTNPDVVCDVRDLDKLSSGSDSADDYLKLSEDSKMFFTFRDAHNTEYDALRKPDAVIIDRPYTPEDADQYRVGRSVFPDLNKLLRDCLNLVKTGGRVGVLDYMVPQGNSGKCVGVYPVIAGTNCRIRAFTVWEKEQ